MSKRELIIKNFRNIGIGDSVARLLLNHSSKIGEIGDLVYLIGPNNSGKSNILDCVFQLGSDEKKISTKDKPDFLDEENLEPEVTLCVEDEFGLFKMTLNTGKCTPSFSLDDEFKRKHYSDYSASVLSASKSVTDILKNYHSLYEIQNDPKLAEILKLESMHFKTNDSLDNLIFNEKQVIQVVDSLCRLLLIQKPTLNVQSSIFSILDDSAKNNIVSVIKTPHYTSLEKSDYAFSLFSDIHGYKFCPNVFRYKEVPIIKKDLKSTIENIDSSPILSSLFKYLKIKKEDVAKKYQHCKETNNVAVLRNLENKYKNKMIEISDKFNQIYASSTIKYSFELNFYPDGIYFSMNYGSSDINIEKQSAGFRWFFDFFFNFMFMNKLEPGDILIMDEPGLCLHVSGQEELRNVLKDFAVKNDITILIATHSPFLVSPDFFDEVRVVDRVTDKNAIIHNNFENANCVDKNNIIYPIVRAFTTYSSVIFNPRHKKYFVEGITDYNYLVAFKKILNIDNLVFVPFNGVGKKEPQMKETCQRLLENCDCNVVLADGDGSGKQFAKISEKSNLKVITLSDIDENWKVIEDLFSHEDKEKIDLKAKYKNKGSEESSRFKNLLIFRKIDVSNETLNNFKKLLEKLAE